MSGSKIPFRKQMEFEYAEVQQITPMIRRVVARNPSNFTFHGTNTYIIGHGNVAVIDPGPMIEEHLEALKSALKDDTVEHILVTHTHNDHSPGAVPLREKIGGQIWGAHLREIVGQQRTSESIDWNFKPDNVLRTGTQIVSDEWTIEAIATPGHMSNHMCFALKEENTLFTGDHIMGWNTTIVSPPDGNMRDYFESLDVCLSREEEIYWPAHGPEITNTKRFTRAYKNHRRMREAEISKCLEKGLGSVQEIVESLYYHLPTDMRGAAGRSVLAHLEHMVETERARLIFNGEKDGRYITI